MRVQSNVLNSHSLNISYFNLLFIHYVCIIKVLTGLIWKGGSSLSFSFIHQKSIKTLIWRELLLLWV